MRGRAGLTMVPKYHRATDMMLPHLPQTSHEAISCLVFNRTTPPRPLLQQAGKRATPALTPLCPRRLLSPAWYDTSRDIASRSSPILSFLHSFILSFLFSFFRSQPSQNPPQRSTSSCFSPPAADASTSPSPFPCPSGRFFGRSRGCGFPS
jgi:hypothetical protein